MFCAAAFESHRHDKCAVTTTVVMITVAIIAWISKPNTTVITFETQKAAIYSISFPLKLIDIQIWCWFYHHEFHQLCPSKWGLLCCRLPYDNHIDFLNINRTRPKWFYCHHFGCGNAHAKTCARPKPICIFINVYKWGELKSDFINIQLFVQHIMNGHTKGRLIKTHNNFGIFFFVLFFFFFFNSQRIIMSQFCKRETHTAILCVDWVDWRTKRRIEGSVLCEIDAPSFAPKSFDVRNTNIWYTLTLRICGNVHTCLKMRSSNVTITRDTH